MKRILAALLLAAPVCWAAQGDPAERVESFHEALLGAMQSGMDFAGRADLLRDPVADFFDIQTIARISLGRTWRTLDAESQAEFSELLQRLILVTYANRFHTFEGQSFHTLAAEALSRGSVVKTELERANGERVTLDYYFRAGGAFNVVADGVSDLSLRRADYNGIIKNEGYVALLQHLRDKIAELSQDE